MPRPHACQPAALAGCPLSPQHWQQHWMWACPTGAFSTSPCRCEYWPHPLPATQAKLTCSVQLAVCLASNGPTTPSVSGTGPCPPSAPCWHPAALHAASSSSEAQCRERCCTCLPGSQGKPGNWTEQSQLLAGWDRGWGGGRQQSGGPDSGTLPVRTQPVSSHSSDALLQRVQSLMSLCLSFSHPSYLVSANVAR